MKLFLQDMRHFRKGPRDRCYHVVRGFKKEVWGSEWMNHDFMPPDMGRKIFMLSYKTKELLCYKLGASPKGMML